MDPIEHINPKKDSTLAMLLAAQHKSWVLYYIRPGDIFLENGQISAHVAALRVQDKLDSWHELSPPQTQNLSNLDVILMRKDPPFDMEYIYTTYLLEKAADEGLLVVNRPDSLRDVNEKFFTAWFPQCCPPTLVSSDADRFRSFLAEHKRIIVKPLDGMGGASIFRIEQDDPNTNVILETLLDHGRRTAMAQRFLPEYTEGDKRILLIDGEPIDYALARLPAAGEGRANLAAGGTYKGVELSERERWICAQVGPELKRRGLIFVGLDVIGDYLTEINVTSPTCIRELDTLYNLNIAGQLMDCLEKKLAR
jgi:glutathione synthase